MDPLAMVETSACTSPSVNNEDHQDLDKGQFLKVRSNDYLQANNDNLIDSDTDPMTKVKLELEDNLEHENEPLIKSEPGDDMSTDTDPSVSNDYSNEALVSSKYPNVHSSVGLASAYQTVNRRRKGEPKEKIFPCTMCLNTFKRRSNLVRHIRTHTKEKPFDCTECDKSFNFKESLKRHLRDHHSKNLCKVCPHCSKEFEEVSDYKAHMEQHKIDGFKCDICSKRFGVKSTMRRHRKTHDEYYAGRSLDTFSEDGQEDGELENDPLTLVKSELTDKPEYPVDVSGQSNEINPASAASDTPVFYPMAVLEKINAGEEVYPCVVCLKTFNRKRNLRRHVRIHTQEKPYQCKECDRAFNHKESLKKHMKDTHMKELGRQCTHCPEEFLDPDEYKAHIEKHKIDGFPCEVCGKRFGEKSVMVKHRKIHLGYKPFPCDDCGKRFRDNNRLNEHRRVHFKDEAFTCKECDKSFVSYRNLLRHQLLHSDEKPFSCEECDKTFSQKKNLENHIKLHRGEKHFACEFCGWAFRLKADLVRHRRIHTGEKPYSCSVCGETFREHKYMKKHLKNHHETTLIDTSTLELHLKSHIDKLVNASGEMFSDELIDEPLFDGQGSKETEDCEKDEKEGHISQENEEMPRSSVSDTSIKETSGTDNIVRDKESSIIQGREENHGRHLIDELMEHSNVNIKADEEQERIDNFEEKSQESFERPHNEIDDNHKIAHTLWSQTPDKMMNYNQDTVPALENLIFDRTRDAQISEDTTSYVMRDKVLNNDQENSENDIVMTDRIRNYLKDTEVERGITSGNVRGQRSVLNEHEAQFSLINEHTEGQRSAAVDTMTRNYPDLLEKHDNMVEGITSSQIPVSPLWNPIADRMRGINESSISTLNIIPGRMNSGGQINVDTFRLADGMTSNHQERLERRGMIDTVISNYQDCLERHSGIMDRISSQGHMGELWNPLGYKMISNNQESLEGLGSMRVNRMMPKNQESLDIQRNTIDYRMMNNTQQSGNTERYHPG